MHAYMDDPMLQLRRSNKGYLIEIISLFFHKKHFCDQSLEPSRRDGSDDG